MERSADRTGHTSPDSHRPAAPIASGVSCERRRNPSEPFFQASSRQISREWSVKGRNARLGLSHGAFRLGTCPPWDVRASVQLRLRSERLAFFVAVPRPHIRGHDTTRLVVAPPVLLPGAPTRLLVTVFAPTTQAVPRPLVTSKGGNWLRFDTTSTSLHSRVFPALFSPNIRRCVAFAIRATEDPGVGSRSSSPRKRAVLDTAESPTAAEFNACSFARCFAERRPVGGVDAEAA